MKVYLAGPDVFLPDAKAVGEHKKEICARYGLVGLFPLDSQKNETQRESATSPSMRIFLACIAMMDEADAVIAHLTPFRGPSADAGTVFELGYMAARGKICAGYTNRRDSYTDRIEGIPGAVSDAGGLVRLDREGHVIEDFGLSENLMIVHALETLGHPVMIPDAEPEDIWRDLTQFERCVQWIAGHVQREGDGN